MKQKPRTPLHEGPRSDTAAPVEEPLTGEQARAAMDKFKSVTRQLLNVSNAALQKELKREKTAKTRPRKRARKSV
jgi:hypothetical protein